MSSDGNSLESKIESVRRRVRDAAAKSGRESDSVRIIGASKKQTIDLLQAAAELGHIDFGENYVQELVEKQAELPEVNWHFIGALQRNKARKVVGKVETIQSVDRISLAKTIEEIATELGIVQKVLIQINIGDESTKGGVSLSDFDEVLKVCKELPHLEVSGVMALPPLTESEAEQLANFKVCAEALSKMQKQFPEAKELSIGTTADFELAIAAGATMVRVGTALFGSRAN